MKLAALSQRMVPSTSHSRLAACSEAARSDPLMFAAVLFAAVLFAAVMLAAVMLAAVRLGSVKSDPAPARTLPLALVSSGRSAIYGTTFGHPAETRSANNIIPPIASRRGGVSHLVGRRLATESYPRFSQNGPVELLFEAARAGQPAV